MQAAIGGSAAVWVDAAVARAGGGRRAGVAHAVTPTSASARAALRPRRFAAGATPASSRRIAQPKRSSAGAAHGDEVTPRAARAKEPTSVNDAKPHALAFALRTVLGRFQSISRLVGFVAMTDGSPTAPPSPAPAPARVSADLPAHTRGDAWLTERGAFCMAMSAGIFGTAVADLSGNLVFMSAFWAWLTAQMMKYITTFYREGRWDWRVMFDSGGMPSSHTALVVGLTTGIAYTYGLGSTLFPLSLAFSLIVMYDAAGVRRHAGRQAAVLNKILENMFQNPESISADKLKEVLGHSPLQVLAGAVLGVFTGIMYVHRFGSGYASLA
mmetsp:Transcript_2608/g.6207  ORF Transcript_2608/g.6207 Transcript_2608/m.6207 type:complete len:327 (-) Transcript_2608:197-1177(-)